MKATTAWRLSRRWGIPEKYDLLQLLAWACPQRGGEESSGVWMVWFCKDLFSSSDFYYLPEIHHPNLMAQVSYGCKVVRDKKIS